MHKQHHIALIFGALIGAILGIGTTFLLIRLPSDLDEEAPETISAKDILKLTSAAALLIRQLDDFRRRL